MSDDFSVNQPSYPPSGLVLLTTIPANAGRANIEVQNQSAGILQAFLDDGSGGNYTLVVLNAATASGSGGGYWSSQTFKGRVLIYGATGSQVTARQDQL